MKDINQAHRDAEAGNVVDQGFLGWTYLYGRFTEVNYQEALRWLSAAAYDGRASRPFIHLGRMYEEGLGVPQDTQEAIRHYRAVAKVEPRATLALARIYASGKGVPSDPAEAVRLYSLVAEHDTWEHDADVVAFAGAVTSDEVEEAKSTYAITNDTARAAERS